MHSRVFASSALLRLVYFLDHVNLVVSVYRRVCAERNARGVDAIVFGLVVF